MTKHSEEIKAHLQNRLSSRFGNIELFSREHTDYIGKFSSLVDSMGVKGEDPREKSAAIQLEDVAGNFLEFIKERNVTLSPSETKKLQVITGSGFEPLVKKRMAEDLMHEIRQRHERDSLLQLKKKKRSDEISKLKYSRIKLVDWLRLTGFSFEFNTITPFSHRIRGATVHDLPKRLKEVIDLLIPFLERALNEKFYLLSNMEYNVLLEVLEVAKAVRGLSLIKWQDSYSSQEISNTLETITRHYTAMIINIDAAERGMRNLVKKDKDSAAVKGAFMFIIDKPLRNGKVARLSRADYLRQTILGLILTYFTIRKGLVVETLNQVMFLADVDGTIDSSAKNLTDAARKREAVSLEANKSELNQNERRIDELRKINGPYLELGRKLEEKIARIEAKTRYQEWLDESAARPLLRVKRLVEACSRYFAEPLFREEGVIFHHDSHNYENVFSQQPRLPGLCRDYTMERFDLIGSKLKDFLKAEMPEGALPDRFIAQILAGAGEEGGVYSFQARVLLKISVLSYKVASQILEVIRDYEANKEVTVENTVSNYDFYLHGVLKRTRLVQTPLLFDREELPMKDFLEGACGFCFYIAAFLQNPYMAALKSEEITIRESLAEQEKDAPQKDTDIEIDPDIDADDNKSVLGELDKMYADTLTGLRKREYLEDVIMPRLYDGDGCYTGNDDRFVFMVEILKLMAINQRYGHKMGNEVVKKCALEISEALKAAGSNRENTVLRYDGLFFLGFLHTESLAGTVDMLLSVVRTLAGTVIEEGGHELTGITAAAAVYQDRSSQSFDEVRNMVFSLLRYSRLSGGGNVVFVKKADHILGPRDFDAAGSVHDELITILE